MKVAGCPLTTDVGPDTEACVGSEIGVVGIGVVGIGVVGIGVVGIGVVGIGVVGIGVVGVALPKVIFRSFS